MKNPSSIVWFRRDLRTADNPALAAARLAGRPVIAVYIHDKKGFFAIGGAQKWFLHYALEALRKSLDGLGIPLVLRRGRAEEILPLLVEESGAAAAYWNRRYAAEEIATDQTIKASLTGNRVEASSFNGALLREPWEIGTKAGGPYRVFTPFWNALRGIGPGRREVAAPEPQAAPASQICSDDLDDWALIPQSPDWAVEFRDCWRPGAAGAAAALDRFLDDPVNRYGEDRNRPDKEGTSRLSPHLALGTISALQVWNATRTATAAGGIAEREGTKFLSEIAWREFAYHLLYHNPAMPTEPLRADFRTFPWRDDEASFRAWTRGQTGVPIVDAGMRELWRTGWMHNRVRMIVASFLVKNLLIPWQKGERWFWDTLVDADPANNAASWQWVAGCGADAAPYFRIFNPVLQGQRFDPDGAYVRAFVPEIAALPNGCIHAPWNAPERALDAAGVRPGDTYPLPIADLEQSRNRALSAYEEMKAAA